MKKFIAALLMIVSLSSLADNVLDIKDMDLNDFITFISKQTKISFVVDPSVKGSVTLNIADFDSTKSILLLSSVLSSRGYQMQRNQNDSADKLVYIVPSEATKKQQELSDLTQANREILPTKTKMYRLKNVSSRAVFQLVVDFVNMQSSNAYSPSNVAIAPNGNALIVTATQEKLDSLNSMIKNFDSKGRQVLVESLIFETNLDKSSEIGFNFSLALKNANFISKTFADVGNAVYSGGDFKALIKAVATDTNSTILSKPRILIRDNQKGFISVGQNVPYLSSTSFQNGTPVQSINRMDVGTSLSITPHILEDTVILDITQKSSSLTASADANLNVITNSRDITTSIQIPFNSSVDIGGLIGSDEKTGTTGIPFLKDIPLVGALFRDKTTTKTTKELNILIKTTVY